MATITSPLLVLVTSAFAISIAGVRDLYATNSTEPGLARAPINIDDRFPAGCVDCHVELPDRDVRIGPLLAGSGHPETDNHEKRIPDGCRTCHSEGGDGEALSAVLHRIHFGKGSDSHFVTEFGGNCLHCHEMDPASGRVTVKSGERNW